jgi:hypothetical protein
MTQYTYDKYCLVLLCLWMDGVLTTEEHGRIIERLTKSYSEEGEEHETD